MHMKRILAACVAVLAISMCVQAQGKRGLKAEDFAQLKDVGDPQISPDGTTIAYTITRTNFEKNARTSEIWLMPVAGGEPHQLTSGTGSSTRPRWSPDGKRI